MKLCMFTPLEHDVRGWPGRIDGDRVIQLAAQTLEAFFTGGGNAREHAEYALDEVRLLAPVQRPPSVRDFYAFEEHVRNAISRFSQTDFEDARARHKAASKIVMAAKRHGIDVDDDSDVVKAWSRG